MTDASGGKRDFFVSFNQADRPWATWIAWVLEEKGYSVFFQDWDFHQNFADHMNEAHRKSAWTIAVFSDHYVGSEFTLLEWSARVAKEPKRLIPVRVGPSSEDHILNAMLYADLTGCGEAEAERRLLEHVKRWIDPAHRPKPETRPGFPGASERKVPERPRFPAAAHNLPAPHHAPKHEFRFQASGLMEHVVSLLLEVKDVDDERRTTLFGDLRAGGLRPIDPRKQHMHMGLHKVRIKLECYDCNPLPGLGRGDDASQSHVDGSYRVNRLGSTLWEIATGSEELYLDGYLIRNAQLTSLAIYEGGKACVEATLRAYPKEIELQDISEDPAHIADNNVSKTIRMKLLKLVLRKAIGRNGDEIVLMRYLIDHHRMSDDDG